MGSFLGAKRYNQSFMNYSQITETLGVDCGQNSLFAKYGNLVFGSASYYLVQSPYDSIVGTLEQTPILGYQKCLVICM